jgi:hypothetical protein
MENCKDACQNRRIRIESSFGKRGDQLIPTDLFAPLRVLINFARKISRKACAKNAMRQFSVKSKWFKKQWLCAFARSFLIYGDFFKLSPQNLRKVLSLCIEIAFFYTIKSFNVKILMFSIQGVTTPRCPLDF